jgi:hypothetical protein
MSVIPVPLTGGESVYCINQAQLEEAFRLAENDPQSSPKIQAEIARLEKEMSRNERASLAFVLIDRLLKTVKKESQN